MSKTLYIVNPAGRGGAGTMAWNRFKTLWPDPIDPEDVVITQRAGHAREIAYGTEGYDTYATVGGDGTVGEVMSAVMDRPGSRPRLAIIPAGTGNDIARCARVFSVDDAVSALREGRSRTFDVIRVDSIVDGKPAHKFGFLLAAAGFSANPKIKPWMKRLLGPTGAYYLGIFLAIIAYRPPHMTVRADGQECSRGRSWLVLAGNTEYSSGGSMRIAPGACPDDGELNTTVFPVKPKFRMATQLLPKVATGDHIKEPGVLYFRAKKIEVECDPPGVIDLDGDLFGTTPATFTVCPQAVQFMSPK